MERSTFPFNSLKMWHSLEVHGMWLNVSRAVCEKVVLVRSGSVIGVSSNSLFV